MHFRTCLRLENFCKVKVLQNLRAKRAICKFLLTLSQETLKNSPTKQNFRNLQTCFSEVSFRLVKHCLFFYYSYTYNFSSRNSDDGRLNCQPFLIIGRRLLLSTHSCGGDATTIAIQHEAARALIKNSFNSLTITEKNC